jgi:RNase P subunit RPR2
MMIRVVRSWFCKHDFIHIKTNEYREGTVTTYMCKKCGWIRKIKTDDL